VLASAGSGLVNVQNYYGNYPHQLWTENSERLAEKFASCFREESLSLEALNGATDEERRSPMRFAPQ